MAAPRIWYLLGLAGCLLFYLVYGHWLSFLLLSGMLILPLLSLLMSLPAMLRFRISLEGAQQIQQGDPAQMEIQATCPAPMPPYRARIRLRSCITGTSRLYRPHQNLPTEHCGGFNVSVTRGKVCDYLSLFSIPMRKPEARTILIRPKPLSIPEPPKLQHSIVRSWKPKSGGGFGENHELRLYRPGDSLNQIHWKLSAKSGNLVLREPMEPLYAPVLLTMTLRGTQEEIDRKFGRLLWMGMYLLNQGSNFEIRVLTAGGIQALPVSSEQELNQAIDTLLCAEAATGSILEFSFAASWKYHIGGEPDEG